MLSGGCCYITETLGGGRIQKKRFFRCGALSNRYTVTMLVS